MMLAHLHYSGVAKEKKSRATPKADRVQITITVNRYFLERIEEMGREVGRNRSEMIDRAVEEYVDRRDGQGERAAG
jgi:metal-responsive CopG/Arc/MetJ family transcriptional regulator